MNSGVPLVCLSVYLGTQSLSCLVYEGVTDCALKNSGMRLMTVLSSIFFQGLLFDAGSMSVGGLVRFLWCDSDNVTC